MGGVGTRIGSSKKIDKSLELLPGQKWPVPRFIPSIRNCICICPFRSFACQRIGFPFSCCLRLSRPCHFIFRAATLTQIRKTEASGRDSRPFTFSNLQAEAYFRMPKVLVASGALRESVTFGDVTIAGSGPTLNPLFEPTRLYKFYEKISSWHIGLFLTRLNLNGSVSKSPNRGQHV